MLLDQSRVREAGELIDQALKLDPSLDAAYTAKGRYYLQTGDMAKALEYGLAGSAANPASAQALLATAIVQYQSGDLEVAAQALDNADRLDKNDPVTSIARTAIAIDQRDADAAILSVGSFLLFRYGRLWLPPVAPALAIVVGYGARVGFDYARERRLRAQVSNAFARYVAPALVEELMKDPKALQLGGERREITVLFCDVRGFTGLSERLKYDPIRLMTIVNRLLDALSAEVLATRGAIDKYMGDCVMAFWNAPVPVGDHPHASVAAALRMGETVARLNVELAAEDPTHRPLAVGVGTGVCVVGNIGSRWRYDYSVLGDTVNLASRLEGLTKEFGVGVIIGPETARRVSDQYEVQKIASPFEVEARRLLSSPSRRNTRTMYRGESTPERSGSKASFASPDVRPRRLE